MRDPSAVRSLAIDDVVSTRRLRDAGLAASWIDRQVREGRWQRLHRGVLVVHSGPVAWRSRARGGLIYAGEGAALSHHSAAFLQGVLDKAPAVVEVSVPGYRKVRPSPGLRIHRRADVSAVGRLPVTDRGTTVLDLLQGADSTDDAVGLLCAAVRARTSPLEILDALARRERFGPRALVLDVMADVRAGVESPLERRYHHQVERRHGLPRAELQARGVIDGRWIRADCRYVRYGLRVELDGELAHPGGRTDDDVWRDNALLLTYGDLTLRYRWRHVAGIPCRTASQVGTALGRRGWTGRLRRCSPACAL
ncbi:hypothetical protein ICW40_19200 [Actinotalea ferrariae]|uniref:hypothetical protein n=1 Tax=Actinotalea ferrariae TaxID=1386098 RepID=UPI001C8B3A62|nr:hypothetical protein [Actinotalea ferrariae]MBX9246921.1 hypothetical protein [Actinotalea ferrariae]